MLRRGALLALITSTALLSACVTRQEAVEHREDLLAAAGFTARPANTPERQQALRTLPPHRFVQMPRGNGFVYLYADPLVCNCLYIGDQAAYGRYQQDVLNRHIATENEVAAQLNADTAWNWGSWGPGWWYP
jgi:hypothetical protein